MNFDDDVSVWADHWKLEIDESGYAVISDPKFVYAEMHWQPNERFEADQNEHKAALVMMHAAPKLYLALKQLLEAYQAATYESTKVGKDREEVVAIAALAQASGGACAQDGSI